MEFKGVKLIDPATQNPVTPEEFTAGIDTSVDDRTMVTIARKATGGVINVLDMFEPHPYQKSFLERLLEEPNPFEAIYSRHRPYPRFRPTFMPMSKANPRFRGKAGSFGLRDYKRRSGSRRSDIKIFIDEADGIDDSFWDNHFPDPLKGIRSLDG